MSYTSDRLARFSEYFGVQFRLIHSHVIWVEKQSIVYYIGMALSMVAVPLVDGDWWSCHQFPWWAVCVWSRVEIYPWPSLHLFLHLSSSPFVQFSIHLSTYMYFSFHSAYSCMHRQALKVLHHLVSCPAHTRSARNKRTKSNFLDLFPKCGEDQWDCNCYITLSMMDLGSFMV